MKLAQHFDQYDKEKQRASGMKEHSEALMELN
jgi:hypothetical protein